MLVIFMLISLTDVESEIERGRQREIYKDRVNVLCAAAAAAAIITSSSVL